MIERQEIVSLFGAMIAIVVIYLPLHWGWIIMSDLGSVISAGLVAASILAWGFRDRIERWRIGSSKYEKLEQELTFLVSPLYAKLNKNDEIIDFIAMYKLSRINIYRDSQRPNGNAKRKELEKLEEEIKEIMLQHGPIASDQLYDLIKKFLDLKPDWKQENSFEAKKALWDIRRITGKRQAELRTMLKNYKS